MSDDPITPPESSVWLVTVRRPGGSDVPWDTSGQIRLMSETEDDARWFADACDPSTVVSVEQLPLSEWLDRMARRVV